MMDEKALLRHLISVLSPFRWTKKDKNEKKGKRQPLKRREKRPL
tara:strand:- start:178 stop:309 length:132 start_codon:yes stop_codon:yes gene_type:complete